MTYSLKGKAMKLEGVPSMVKTLQTIATTLQGEQQTAFTDKLRDIVMKPAKVIRDEAQDLVPVVTGTLKAGIFAAPINNKAGAIVGVHHVFYAPFVEYGTRRMRAHPFFRPAINATRPMAANMMSGDMKALIDEIAKSTAWHESQGTAPSE